jgi:acyl-CoA synthetase (AMP-forming)/AMP-acid ligase II
MNLWDLLAGHADTHGSSPALVEGDEIVTYADLAVHAETLACYLRAEGRSQPGDRAAIWMTNSGEWITALLGSLTAGLVVFGIDPRATDAEVAHLFGQLEPSIVFTEAALVSRAHQAQASIGLDAHVVVKGDSDGRASFADVLADVRTRTFADPHESDNAFIINTSGTTTGRAKPLLHDQWNVVHGLGQAWSDALHIERDDRSFFVTPLTHGCAMVATMSALWAGASVSCQPTFRRRDFWNDVLRNRPTYLFALYPIVAMLMTLLPSPAEQDSTIGLGYIVGAADEGPRIQDRFGFPVVDSYGASEMLTGTVTPVAGRGGDGSWVIGPTKKGSAGKALSICLLVIVDDDGRQCAPGQVGEILSKFGNHQSFLGYFNQPEATSEVVRDGWIHTGDLGYLDDDGYLFYVDRLKDMVRRGGENISPSEVEKVLLGSSDIVEAAVVGQKDSVLGERLIAAIQFADRPMTLFEVQQLCQGQLASYKHPEGLIALDAMPRTGTGKIQKQKLREGMESGEYQVTYA